MKKFAFLAAASVAIIATPAAAHEGPYVGIIGGYDSVKAKYDGESESEGNIMYGVVAGYDKHVSNLVMAGVEVEYADSSVKVGDDDLDASLRASRDLYAGARLGFHVAEGTMVYAKGGYTNGQLKIAGKQDDLSFRVSKNLDGYRLGAGVEHTFDHVGIRLEYRYSDYGNVKILGEDTGVSMSRHQVVAGILAKF